MTCFAIWLIIHPRIDKATPSKQTTHPSFSGLTLCLSWVLQWYDLEIYHSHSPWDPDAGAEWDLANLSLFWALVSAPPPPLHSWTRIWLVLYPSVVLCHAVTREMEATELIILKEDESWRITLPMDLSTNCIPIVNINVWYWLEYHNKRMPIYFACCILSK